VSRVRSLDGGPPDRAGRTGISTVASVQAVRSTYLTPEPSRAPRGRRDPWLVTGVVVIAVMGVGWINNPSLAHTRVPIGLRTVQLLVAVVPVLGLVAWLSAVLRTRHGGGGWGPPALVAAGGVWVLLLSIVLVLHGAQGQVCDGLARCASSTGARLALAAPLVAMWVAARMLDGALVVRRAGVQWRAPQEVT